MKLSPVEDVAAAIAEQVREKGWNLEVHRHMIFISTDPTVQGHICTLFCQDASQAKRLAEMMRGKA